MVSKCLLILGLMVASAAAGSMWGGAGWPQPATLGAWQPGDTGNPWAPGGGVNPWMPSWIATAPWFPQWAPCSTIGSSCSDCTTRQICTKIGGMKRACTDPSLPHCNLGECSATPSDECQPTTNA